MSAEDNRRQYLKRELPDIEISAEEMPAWIEIEDDELFKELVEICTEVLEEDELFDLMDTADLTDGLGLVFTFLIEKEIDPEQYLLMKDFLE